MKRGMNGKLLSQIEAGEDISAPIVQIVPRGWAALQRNVPICLRNGIMRRTKMHHKIVLRVPTKKCGGNVNGLDILGVLLFITEFTEAYVRYAEENCMFLFRKRLSTFISIKFTLTLNGGCLSSGDMNWIFIYQKRK